MPFGFIMHHRCYVYCKNKPNINAASKFNPFKFCTSIIKFTNYFTNFHDKIGCFIQLLCLKIIIYLCTMSRTK